MPAIPGLRKTGGCAEVLIDAQNRPIDTEQSRDVFQAGTDRDRQVIDKKQQLGAVGALGMISCEDWAVRHAWQRALQRGVEAEVQ